MTYSIIGGGNMAWFLGKKLTAGGHRCVGIYARDVEKIKPLASEILCNEVGELRDVRDGDADICFITISDHAIASVASGLNFKKTVLAHTSGSISLDALEKAAADRAVLWPVYSIVKDNLPNHRNIPCAWEATTNRAERFILSIGHTITDTLFEAKSDQRKWLHLCAVLTSNFMNHLMTVAEQICVENNLPYSTMQPIIQQTFERTRQASPYTLQTGPALRRDTTTMHEHIGMLRGHQHWQRVYEILSDSIDNMYRMQAYQKVKEI
jgi:predicted short-subunit dehydrogenase-like oxidoreductase (DUF2520 family)